MKNEVAFVNEEEDGEKEDILCYTAQNYLLTSENWEENDTCQEFQSQFQSNCCKCNIV